MPTWIGERSSMSRRASKQNAIAKLAIGAALALGLGGGACVIYVDETGDNQGPTPHHHHVDARVAPQRDARVRDAGAMAVSDAEVSIDSEMPDAAIDAATIIDAGTADAATIIDAAIVVDADVVDAAVDANSTDAAPAQPGCPTEAECAVCGSSCVAVDECETGGFDTLCFSCGVPIVETFDPSDWQTECGE